MRNNKNIPEYAKSFDPNLDDLNNLFENRIIVGTVVSVLDMSCKGSIAVMLDTLGTSATVNANAATPFAGTDYGFFSVPTPGTRVLVLKPETNDGSDWIWFACLVGDHASIPGNKVTPIDRSDQSRYPDTEVKEYENSEPVRRSDSPDCFVVYEDNFLPEQYIWKSPDGHKFVMSDKVTQQRIKKFIKMRSSGGKEIVIDDSPANQGGDNIRIIDEQGNSIIIQTGGKEGGWIKEFAKNTLEMVSKGGDISQTILGGEGDIISENLGKGGIKAIAHKGNITITSAKKNVNVKANQDFTVSSSVIEYDADERLTVKVGTSTVEVSQESINLTTESGEVYIGPGGIRLANPGQPISFIGTGFNFIVS